MSGFVGRLIEGGKIHFGHVSDPFFDRVPECAEFFGRLAVWVGFDDAVPVVERPGVVAPIANDGRRHGEAEFVENVERLQRVRIFRHAAFGGGLGDDEQGALQSASLLQDSVGIAGRLKVQNGRTNRNDDQVRMHGELLVAFAAARFSVQEHQIFICMFHVLDNIRNFHAARHVAEEQLSDGVVSLFEAAGNAALRIEIEDRRGDAVMNSVGVKVGRDGGLYTRTDAREQERMTLRLSDAIAARRYKVKEAAIQNAIASRSMNAEQVEAFRRHVGGEGMTLCQGSAGTGKSYMIGAVREVHQASNFRVIGLAPTNTVAADMKKDGFFEASTVHAAVFAPEKGKAKWNDKTLIIVDEAGMLDTEILLKLLRHAATSGAKLVIVGDDRQLSSVGRGGMWPLLVDRYKASRMNQINRQEEDWQKAASVALSDGRSGDALRDYNDRGFLHWNDRVDDAMDALLKKYDGDTQADPDGVRFIYASTNEAVNALNAEVNDLHVRRGDVTDVHAFETKRGPISMGVGDRFQFYENKKDAGVINGLMGKVIGASPDEVKVLTDAGDMVSIDPQEYQDFGHGYAGTVYRGQGKTVAHSYCFYDSKFAWSAKSAYVAMTRHKKQVDLFVPRELAPDFDHLVRQISREGRDGASLNWATEGDLKEFDKVVRAKSPKKSDPFKATWSKLWADFVVKATDVIAGLAQPARQSVSVILDKGRFQKRPSKVATETVFGLDEYRQNIRGMAAYKLRDEYAEQKSLHEVTEAPGGIQEIEAKLKAIEAEAARHGIDLANDPRIAQRERAEMQRRKEIIRQAQQKKKNEVKS